MHAAVPAVRGCHHQPSQRHQRAQVTQHGFDWPATRQPRIVLHSRHWGLLFVPASCFLLPTTYCLLPFAFCLLPIAYRLLPIASCLLYIAYCLLPIGQVPTACSLLPVAHYVLLA